MRVLGCHEDQRYIDRLRVELDVICERGFSKYFLTMKSYIACGKNDGYKPIGTIVVYMVLKYNLLLQKNQKYLLK